MKNKKLKTFIFMGLLASLLPSYGKDLDDLRKKYNLGNFFEYKGKKIHYMDEGQGKVLLAIHGTSDSLRTWDFLSKELTEKYRVIRLDIPGFGLSDNSKIDDFWPYKISLMITALVDHLGVEKFSIIGNSLGGYYAWNYAVHRPARVEKVFLLAPFAFDLEEYPLLVRLGKSKLAEFVSEYFPSKSLVKYILSSAVENQEYLTEKIIERFFDFGHANGRPALYNQLFNRISHLPFLTPEKLEVFIDKLVLIWGEEDKWLTPDGAQKWPELAKGKKVNLHILPNTGHLPQIDCPSCVKTIIEKSF